MFEENLAIHILLAFSLYSVCLSDRVHNKIYIDLNAEVMPLCPRLLNGTHSFGCTSSRFGNVGIVHYVQSDDDIAYLKSSDAKFMPYIPVLEPRYFTNSIIETFINIDKVNGVIVLHTNSSLRDTFSNDDFEFTPDDSCPNRGFGYDNTHEECSIPWNINTNNNFLFLQIPFPIFLISNQTARDVIINQCYYKFNYMNKTSESGEIDWPLCAAELTSFMVAANSSLTCIRRNTIQTNLKQDRFCDPLESYNVYGSHLATSKEHNRKQIVVAARIDSTSMFVSGNVGLNSALTGLISSLTTAHILRDMGYNDTEDKRKYDIIFLLLHGESYDYIGSSKILYDMSEGTFPFQLDSSVEHQPQRVSLDSIAYFIELTQLAPPVTWDSNTPSELNVYYNTTNQDAVTVFTTLNSMSAGVNVSLSQATTNPPDILPPSSSQRFLSERADLPALLITANKDNKLTRFYNSRFDILSAYGINFTSLGEPYNQSAEGKSATALSIQISRLALTLARALYKLAYEEDVPAGRYKINDTLLTETDEMLYCFAYSSKCELFMKVVSPKVAKKMRDLPARPPPYNTYVSVANAQNDLAYIVSALLSYYLRLSVTPGGEDIPGSEEACKGDGDMRASYQWISGGEEGELASCIVSSVWYLKSKSPAFMIPHYDLSRNPRRLSTWVESVWNEPSMRLFLKPDPAYEITILTVGTLVAILSFITVYWAQRRIQVISVQT